MLPAVPLEQVVRRHRRDLLDRAFGMVEETPPTTTPGTPMSEISKSSLLFSLGSFHSVVAQFEKLGRCAPPPSLSELVHSDAYMVALGLSRRKEVRIFSMKTQ